MGRAPEWFQTARADRLQSPNGEQDALPTRRWMPIFSGIAAPESAGTSWVINSRIGCFEMPDYLCKSAYRRLQNA